VREFASPLDRWVLLPMLSLLPARRRRAVMEQRSMRDVVRLCGPPWYTTWDQHRARISVAALKGLHPRVIAGGHGAPFVARRTAAPVQAPRAGVR